eukprot:5538698-Pyramimonas_sp.AAC.1
MPLVQRDPVDGGVAKVHAEAVRVLVPLQVPHAEQAPHHVGVHLAAEVEVVAAGGVGGSEDGGDAEV